MCRSSEPAWGGDAWERCSAGVRGVVGCGVVCCGLLDVGRLLGSCVGLLCVVRVSLGWLFV